MALPKYEDDGELLKWLLKENVPGKFPYTGGVFPFKRDGEDPTRMFAGEGDPVPHQQAFHYLSKDSPAKRLSTAFDSVTLYGWDPDERPDIYGKVGNSGVSIATLDDMKALYDGFDLCDPSTSVSMTINGPAPDHPGDVLQHRHRPANGQVRRQGPGARTRRRPRRASGPGRCRPFGAPCRRIS